MPDTPRPDPAALAALPERATKDFGAYASNCPCPSCAERRADAAELRAWAPLLTAAVRFTEAQDRIKRAKKARLRSGCAGDGSAWAAAYGEYLAACDDSAAAKEAYRAALAPGAGEADRG